MEQADLEHAILSWVRAQARRLRHKECFKTIVSPWLEELEREIKPNVIGPHTRSARNLKRALESNCRQCPFLGKCKSLERLAA